VELSRYTASPLFHTFNKHLFVAPTSEANWFELIRDVSQSLGMLRIAASQRKEPERAQELVEIDELISSCYEPVILALEETGLDD
jgi:hypothetical protein